MPPPPHILVTGATGLVGGAVARVLRARGAEVHGGGRQAQAPKGWTGPWRQVDLERPSGAALGGAFDAVFILRPPALTDPAPFAALAAGCDPGTRLVFLSVQGAGSRAWLPHARIEKALAASGRPCHALRPGYFMENLTGALAPLLAEGVLRLPSGGLAFNWTAVDDIAEAAATLLLQGGPAACELSGPEALGFGPALAQASAEAGADLAYEPIGLARYLAQARGRGEAWAYIGVQLLLHWWPRWAGQDPVAGDPQGLLGRAPMTLREWARGHAAELRALRKGGGQ